MGYLPNKLNFVKIEVINEKITISVSHDYRDLIEVLSISTDYQQGGAVGFGTYKVPTQFSTVNLSPPSLEMTPGDVNKVLTTSIARLFSSTPFPSPKKIEDLHIREGKLGRSVGASAIENIKNQITRFSSSLGYNFATAKPEEPIKKDTAQDEKEDVDVNNNNDSPAAWKSCVAARSAQDRNNWCSSKYPSAFIQSKCEENFCDMCCTTNTAVGSKNVTHMCKKGCYRAAIAIDVNKDYDNVCINSPNNVQNIYGYCEDKFATYNPKLINSCKLDMCNVCCVGMDAIKKKNYSVPNLKSCFSDCSKTYNMILEDTDVKEGGKGEEKCESPQKVDIEGVNKEEFVDVSYVVKSYMKYMDPKDKEMQ